MDNRSRVLVALSGGVDSSVAAILLQRSGYLCDGATLSLCGETDCSGAENVAKQLQMRFFIFDEKARFDADVLTPFSAEYCAGLTPNPCIFCNHSLKFGAFLDRALSLGYDFVATGHYVRTRKTDAGIHLLRGLDQQKDQSYFLYRLTQTQLQHLLFPLGGYEKSAIRDLARCSGLKNADRSDSQDICFIPDGNYVEFLKRRGVELVPGNFVDQNGTVLGRHQGLPCYTIGQGKGLGIALGKHVYVLKKDAESNTIALGDNEALFRTELTARNANWITETPAESFRCTGKTRYTQREDPCTVTLLSNGRMRVVFDTPQRAITPGQAVVLYDGDVVLGGGTID